MSLPLSSFLERNKQNKSLINFWTTNCLSNSDCWRFIKAAITYLLNKHKNQREYFMVQSLLLNGSTSLKNSELKVRNDSDIARKSEDTLKQVESKNKQQNFSEVLKENIHNDSLNKEGMNKAELNKESTDKEKGARISASDEALISKEQQTKLSQNVDDAKDESSQNLLSESLGEFPNEDRQYYLNKEGKETENLDRRIDSDVEIDVLTAENEIDYKVKSEAQVKNVEKADSKSINGDINYFTRVDDIEFNDVDSVNGDNQQLQDSSSQQTQLLSSIQAAQEVNTNINNTNASVEEASVISTEAIKSDLINNNAINTKTIEVEQSSDVDKKNKSNLLAETDLISTEAIKSDLINNNAINAKAIEVEQSSDVDKKNKSNLLAETDLISTEAIKGDLINNNAINTKAIEVEQSSDVDKKNKSDLLEEASVISTGLINNGLINNSTINTKAIEAEASSGPGENNKIDLLTSTEKVSQVLTGKVITDNSVNNHAENISDEAEAALADSSDENNLPLLKTDKNDSALNPVKTEAPITSSVADVNGAKPIQTNLIQTDKLVAVNQQTQANNNLLEAPLDIQSKQAASAIGERVMMMISQSKQEVQIRLDPAELGSIFIKAHVHQDQVQLNIQTQAGLSKEIIEQNMPRLREQLAQQGLQLGEANVEQQPQQSQQQNHQSGHGQMQTMAAKLSQNTEVTEDNQTAIWMPSKIASKEQGIDYYA